MRMVRKLSLVLFWIGISSVLLFACTPEPIIETVTVETAVQETVIVTQAATPTPTTEPMPVIDTPQSSTPPSSTPPPTATPIPEPRTLVICMGQEPDSLYLYGGTTILPMNAILDAIYDGPIDTVSYEHLPVIIEEIPNLANGSAVIQAVEVNSGSTIVDNDGVLTRLQSGVLYRPTGCNSSSCAEQYSSGAVTMDRIVATFMLLPGITWADGTPMTANDSVYSFDLAAHPDTPRDKFKTQRTESYQALDTRTVVWTSVPGFLDPNYPTNFWTPLPRHLLETYTPAELLDEERSAVRPMGWGPYKIDEWVKGEFISLSKNANYFRAEEGLPKFEHVVYRFVGVNSNANIARILSGECDIVDQTARLGDQSDLLIELDTIDELNAHFSPDTIWEHADFGIVPASYADGWTQQDDRPNYFGDVRVRQAIAYCMDRQTVVDQLLFGRSPVMDSYLPATHPLYNTSLEKYAFDPETGNALLEEAGWFDRDVNGVREYYGDDPNIPRGTNLAFEYWVTDTPLRQAAGEIFAESLLNCGVELTVRAWAPSEFFAEGPDGLLRGRRFEIAQFAWESLVVPICALYQSSSIPGLENGWAGWNVSGFSDGNYDAACERAQEALPGQPAYQEAHLEAQRIFAENLPAIPLYLQLNLAATRPDMRGFLMNPTTNSAMWNIEAFDYGNGGSD